ncbi:MAG: DUF6600 domain-containing protein [Bryobacteraceae bacterium]
MPRAPHLWTVLAAFLALAVDTRGQFKPAPPPYSQTDYGPAAQVPYGDGEAPSDDPEAAEDQQHGVARLSVLLGEVGVRRGDTSELVAAAVNAPLQKGDGVQTATTGAAEIQVDSANVVRVAENSEIGFSDLQLQRVQIQLNAGSALYRVLRASSVDVEIDTPSVAVRPLGVSAVRVTILEGGVVRIAVYTGSAEMLGSQGTQPLQAGTTVLARMGASGPEFQQTGSLPQDQFDAWNSSRDEELLNSPSVPLVGPEVSGTEDLDRNGNWVPSQYGQVWEPQGVGPDWAPYSSGEWAWQGYYGWTWVDSAPWGWAPYHYGRWFRNGSYGWCWWPGTRGAIHVWRPALVGFFGSGGGLGWVALAPHEPFQAWWGQRSWIGGNRYPGGTVRFQNAAFRSAAMFVGRDNFSGPHQRFGWATPDQLRGATRFDGHLPVTPTRSSYRFSDRSFVVNRGTPAWTARTSTSQSRFAVTPRAGYSRPVASGAAGNGWQRFGDPGAPRNYEHGSFTVAPRNESGWHQFGRPPSPQAPEATRSFANRSDRSYEAPRTLPRPSAAMPSTGWRSFASRPSPQTWSGSVNRVPGGESRYTAPERHFQQSPAPSVPHYGQSGRESYRAPSTPNYSRQPARPVPNSGGGYGNRGGGGGGRSDGGGGRSRR